MSFVSVGLEVLCLSFKYAIPALGYSLMCEIKIIPIFFSLKQQKKTEYLVTQTILGQYNEK